MIAFLYDREGGRVGTAYMDEPTPMVAWRSARPFDVHAHDDLIFLRECGIEEERFEFDLVRHFAWVEPWRSDGALVYIEVT